MSDTPRTDAREIISSYGRRVDAEFARDLERSLTRMQEDNGEMRKILDEVNRLPLGPSGFCSLPLIGLKERAHEALRKK